MRARLQEIPDLGQQGLLRRERSGRCGFFALRAHEPPQKFDDEEEDGERDNEKVEHFPEEQPIRDLLAVQHKLPCEIALLARHEDADERHEHMLDQRINQLPESRANDHPTARSMTLPLNAKCLNSSTRDQACRVGTLDASRCTGSIRAAFLRASHAHTPCRYSKSDDLPLPLAHDTHGQHGTQEGLLLLP